MLVLEDNTEPGLELDSTCYSMLTLRNIFLPGRVNTTVPRVVAYANARLS